MKRFCEWIALILLIIMLIALFISVIIWPCGI
jgi:hypothetical protein